MCAINGFSYKDPSLLNKMMKISENRGPDWQDVHFDEEISLGHNRLSILDINKRSNQPFKYKNLVLSFNGEIYNFKDLKKELENKNYKFYTESDTEVLIKLFYEFNLDAFKKISGIFSISIWDNLTKTIYLIRDIIGVKPLYYKEKNGNIFFSSLINPLLIDDKKILNSDALNYYSNFGYNDLPETFYKNIFKVLPGELIIFKNKKIIKEKFLKFDFNKNNLSDQNIKEKIEEIISKQSISDVPVSLSLSGGIDSNILLSKIKKNLNSYTVAYEYKNNKNIDSICAKQRAKEFNIKHTEVFINQDDFFNSLENIIDILEEPIGNENVVGNYFLSKNIKEKVLFVGDGGDEIFTGYNKYRSLYFISLLNKFNLFKFLNFKSNNKNINRIFMKNSNELHLSFSNQNLLSQKNSSKFYKKIKPDNIFYNHFSFENSKPSLENIMLADIDTWVQNDVLIRNDKIYMNEAIEVRVPYLDKEMIDNFLYVNTFKKINFFNQTKPLMRKIFKNELNNILKMKKGFNSPFNFWINDKKNIDRLRYYFSKEYYKSELIDYNYINQLIENGSKKSFEIFSVLMLQIFLKKNHF